MDTYIYSKSVKTKTRKIYIKFTVSVTSEEGRLDWESEQTGLLHWLFHLPETLSPDKFPLH